MYLSFLALNLRCVELALGTSLVSNLALMHWIPRTANVQSAGIRKKLCFFKVDCLFCCNISFVQLLKVYYLVNKLLQINCVC